LTGISHRSVITIFGKIRGASPKSASASRPSRTAKSKSMNLTSARTASEASAVAGPGVRPSSSAYSSATAVYTEIVPDCKKATLQAIIRGRVSADAVIHSDGWRGYDGLVDVGYAKHFRVHHGANEFANGESHINGIESFWSYAKRRLTEVQRRARGDLPSALERVRI
jgi:transposase